MPDRTSWKTDARVDVRFWPLFLAAIAVLVVPALWTVVANTCSEAAWYVPVIASTALAAAACFQLGGRRGHLVVGAVAAVVGGGLWFWVALLVAFIVWLPFVPDRCTYDFGI